MSNINVTVRMDSELKTRADEMFAQMGMNLSTAVNIFLRQTLREGQLPFTPSLVPNAETVAALEESEQLLRRLRSGEDVQTFEVEDALRELKR